MAWYRRLKEDENVYSPRSCPDYRDPEFFTIKLFYGGEMHEEPEKYVGGSYAYFDYCHKDEFSKLDISAMLRELGEIKSEVLQLWYRFPRSDGANGIYYELETDKDVLYMVDMMEDVVPEVKYDMVFAVYSDPPLSSLPEAHMGNVEPDPMNTQYEDVEFEEGNGTPVQQNDIGGSRSTNGDHDETSEESDEEYKGGSEDDSESFHSDSSNEDEDEDHLDLEILIEGGHFEQENSSDYGGSDEERMACNSTDDENEDFHVFQEGDGVPTFEVGLCFVSAKALRKAVRKYDVLERRPIVNCRSFGRKIQYICQKPCKWRLYAAPMHNSCSFQIRTYVNNHTCMQTYHQKQISSKWLAEYYEKQLRLNPSWKPDAFHKTIVNELKCHVSKWAVYRARRTALRKINITHMKQYGEVWKYGHALKEAIPESTVMIMCEPPEQGADAGRFQRMYVCLGPLKRAYLENCRKIIGLDACHLKGPYGGQLLAAVGIDANDGMYPIAWAVAEIENGECWTWFLELLTRDLKITNNKDWTFMSDKQKGLINALEAVVPGSEVRFCVMHLYKNMYKDHKGVELRSLLWKAARATTIWEFNKHMAAMKKLSKKCHDWLIENPKEQWSRCGFRLTPSTDMFVNNHCEVFNSSIRPYRDLPIHSMFSQIHIAVMKRIQIRRDKMRAREDILCPSAEKKLRKAMNLAGNCEVTWSGGSKYSIKVRSSGHELVVDIDKKTCSCRKWDLTGMPCYHAIAVIQMRNADWDMHTAHWYMTNNYVQTYSHILDPIVGPKFWNEIPEPAPLPPNVKTPTRRPKKKRNAANDIPRDPNKLPRRLGAHCGYCKERGHNERTCEKKINDLKGKGQAAVKGKNTCKKCGLKGHNVRTCKFTGNAGETNSSQVRTENVNEGMNDDVNQGQIRNQGSGNEGTSGSAKVRKLTKKTARKSITKA